MEPTNHPFRKEHDLPKVGRHCEAIVEWYQRGVSPTWGSENGPNRRMGVWEGKGSQARQSQSHPP